MNQARVKADLLAYTRALFLVQLAAKDQLIKLRAVRSDYQLVHRSVLYATESKRIQGLGDGGPPTAPHDDELGPAAEILSVQLKELLLVEADALHTMGELHALTMRLRHDQDVAKAFHEITSEPEPTQPDPWERLRHLSPRDLLEIIEPSTIAEVPRDARAPTSTLLDIAGLRLLGPTELARKIKAPGSDQLYERLAARLRVIRGRGPHAIALDAWVGRLCDDVDARAVRRQEARAARIHADLLRSHEGSNGDRYPLGSLGPLGTFLFALGDLESRLDTCLALLSSARRTITRWASALGPGYPILPAYHKQDRSQHYRAFHRLLEEAARTVARLGDVVARSSHNPSSTRDPEVLTTFSFTDRMHTEALRTEAGLHRAVEYPAFYLDHPRYFSDGFHECSHSAFETRNLTGQNAKEQLTPEFCRIVESLRIREQRRAQQLGLPFETTVFEYTATELLVDSIATAAAGGGYLLTFLMSGLTLSGWHPASSQRALEPIVRAWAIAHGAADHWFKSTDEGGGRPTRRPAYIGHLLDCLDALLSVHTWEHVQRTRGPEAEALTKDRRRAAAYGAMAHDAARSLREFVFEVLEALKAESEASDERGKIWLARRVDQDNVPAGIKELFEALRRYTKPMLERSIAEIQGGKLDAAPPLDYVVLTQPLPTAEAKPAHEYASHNTIQLTWQWWFEAALTAWGVRVDNEASQPTARPWLVAFEAVEDAPVFTYLASAIQAQARASDESDATFGKHHFGVGAALTIAQYDCLWRRHTGVISLREWLIPQDNGHQPKDDITGPLTSLGEIDLVTLAPRWALEDLRTATSDLVQDLQPGDTEFFVRHLDFEVVPRDRLCEVLGVDAKNIPRLNGYTYASAEGEPEDVGTKKVVERLYGGQAWRKQTPGVFVLLQHVQRSRAGKPSSRRGPGLRDHLDFHKRMILKKGHGRSHLQLGALLRSYTWTDTALWWETEGDPVHAVTEALNNGLNGPSARLLPLTDTVVLYRHTKAYKDLVNRICPDASTRPIEALEKLAEVAVRTRSNAVTPNHLLTFHIQLWVKRGRVASGLARPGAFQKKVAPIIEALARIEQRLGSGLGPKLEVEQLAGGADIGARLVLPPLWSAKAGATCPQAFAAVLQLTTAWALADAFEAFEVVTNVAVRELPKQA